MLQKTHLLPLQSIKLPSDELQFAQTDVNIAKTLCSTHKTPKNPSLNMQQFDAIKTQKMPVAGRLEVHRVRLPSLTKYQTQQKENLLDLDQAFEKQRDGNYFVIRTFKTPTEASKGKQTSAESNENSLEQVNSQTPKMKNATEPKQIKEYPQRHRSYSKNVQTCRIVNSKKLPFDLNCKSRNKKVTLFQGLNVSLILPKDQQIQSSHEIITNIYQYL